MARNLKSIAAVIGAASVLGLGGVAIAANGDSDERASNLAAALSTPTGTEVTSEDVIAAQKQVANDRVDELLADGEITQEQADEMRERIENGELRGPGHRGGPGGGPIGSVAEDLGLDRDSLRDALREGQSLAEYAESQGVTRDQVVAAIEGSLIEKAEERGIDADASEITERAESIADGERGGRGPGGFGGPPPIG